MKIKIINEHTEIVIDLEKENFENFEKEIQLCLNGSYTYVSIKDKNENIHYVTLGFLKNSYITITDDNIPYENDSL
ncbi:hypothetical protein [Chryseobacterium indoltheticum]|uniref:Uncharacterized protein n=1 Tax=Chryseobacterium indoltheticum TaxID=254 RepID=A0A381FJA9_9FLAO|nr:hypothetical protein [Chryseobacterium indoltheticum]SUX46625.1 Uncharacterised protein [Chryseobacterium indoltheticum]